MSLSKLTYSKSGVNIKKADKFVKHISTMSKRANKSGDFKNIGGFGAISAVPKNLKEPHIVTSTDGGTTWTNLLTAPTSSECKTITWNGKLWILTINSTTFYTSYDLITWTTIVHDHTVYVGRSNYILPHKGHNLYKFTNDNFRDYCYHI